MSEQSAGTVVVADDEAAIAAMLERLLVARGYVVLTAADGQEALDLIREVQPDIVLSDVRMPKTDGFELCQAVKEDAATRLIPVVLMTGAAERQDRIRAIATGADDLLAKPIDEQELIARVASLIRLKRYTDDLDSAESVIMSLALTIEARDPSTDGHCQRLAAYGVALGRALGLGDTDLQALRRGGFIHDIGKIGVPDAILLKPGKLDDAEIRVMRQHTVIGDKLCGNLRALRPVRQIVRSHHERLDGTGYPDGLQGEAIPLLAQIVSVVDVYDALTTERPYKKALPPEAAFVVLRDEVRRGWKRPDLVEVLIQAVQAGTLGDSPY